MAIVGDTSFRPLDLVGSFQGAQHNALTGQMNRLKMQEAQRGMQRQNALLKIAPQAFAGDQNALSQMAGYDPNAAVAMGGYHQKQQEASLERVGSMAGVLASAPPPMRQQIYEQMLPELERSGLFTNLPPQWSDEMLPIAESLSQQLGGTRNNVQSRFVGADGNVYALMRDGSVQPLNIKADPGMSQQTITVDDNGTPRQMTFDKRSGTYRTPQMGAPGSSAPQTGQDHHANFSSAAQNFGAQITSLNRTPERNTAVGGASGSQHIPRGAGLNGTAADFVVPPQNKAAFIQHMQGQGYEVIDEGDHVHVELPPSRQLFVGRRKEDEAAAVEQAKTNVQLKNAPAVADADAEAARKRKEAEAAAERNATIAKKTAQAQDRKQLYDMAESLLPESTGSGVGALYDAGAAAFGRSTAGAEAGDQLAIIAGTLTSMVPRMEGPQSNFDVSLYQKMAGDLGNVRLPRERRLAALRTLRQLDQKYAHLNQDGPQQPSGGATGSWSIRKK